MCQIVTSKSLLKSTKRSDLRQVTTPLSALSPQNLLSRWCWQELKLLGPKRKKGFPRWLSGKEHACHAGDTGDTGLIPGLGRSLWRRGMATHSSILAWRIPWTKEPGGLRSIGLQRVGCDCSDWAQEKERKQSVFSWRNSLSPFPWLHSSTQADCSGRFI